MDLGAELRRSRASWASTIERAHVQNHPYGFLVIRPGIKLDANEVRFHVWLKRERIPQQPEWPIHSHDADMLSYIIKGGLDNITWREPRIGLGAPLYFVSYENNKSVLTQSEIRVRVGAGTSQCVRQGEQYRVMQGQFHQTRVPFDADCLSLCVFSGAEKGHATVVGEDGYPSRLEFDRSQLGPTAVRAAKDELRLALSAD